MLAWYHRRYGEVVPLGPNYLPSYAGGVLAGLKELGPKLIGKDPTQLKVMNRFMDYELKGHPYVKSPIDMACWDILGKVIKLIHMLKSYFGDIFIWRLLKFQELSSFKFVSRFQSCRL